MTLLALLKVLNPDDYIGLWDISYPVEYRKNKPFGECPTKQQYFKLKNMPYSRLRDKLDSDVYCINYTEKGLLIRIGRKDDVKKSLNNYDLARKIAEEMKGH